MIRISPAAGLVLLVLALAPAPLLAQPGMPPDDPDSWKVAGTAKVLCSALFVSGRELAEARAHVADYFLREKLDSITDLHVDRDRKLVRLTVANRVTREARLYGDQGCIIHQPGRDTVFFTPVRVTSRLTEAATTPWPMGDLLPTLPSPSGLDSTKLRQATDAAFANPAGLTAGFVVVYQGRIVAERYANGATQDMQLESWSMGKSITGTLIGMLIHQGALRLEDPAPVPEWHKTPGDPRAKIRVLDLLRMSSGLRFSRGSPEDLPGYHDHDLIYTGAIDAFQFAVTREPQFEPNTFGRYRNVDVMTLGLLIRDAVQARGENYLAWPQRALFDKIGVRRQVLETDPYGNFLLSGYDYGTARNWARLGMLYLNDGVWNGERLLPEGWTRLVSTPAPAWADSSYGGMVWVNGRGAWPLPRDAFAFRGAGGQETYVVPSLELVVVRMGHFPGSRVGGQDLQRALRLIREALPADPGPAHDSFTVQSRVLDEARPINVYVPPAYRSAPSALPVLYMPDGGLDEDFPHVIGTVDSLIGLGLIRPVIVVGIPNTQRRRDLTGPTRVASDSAIAPRVGGSAAFRRFLRQELMPEVERRYRTTTERAIIGESLAGLFIVETLLEDPALFTHYVALDPSLWWNKAALLDSAQARLGASQPVSRTLYLASSSVAEIAAGTARLAALLQAAGTPGLRWRYEPRPDLTHATIFRALKATALGDALRLTGKP